MRILLLVTGLGVGGAERQVVDLADAFVAAGHKVLLVCLSGKAILRPTSQDVRVVTLGMTKGPLGFMRTAVAYKRLIESFNPDVVHTHMVHSNLFARVLRMWTAIPVLISSAHNTNEEGWWRMLGYTVTDQLANLSTNVSVEAVGVFERWHAVRKGRMIPVHNGISISKFQFDLQARERVRAEMGIAQTHKLLLAVGRLASPKDYPNLLHAFALVRRRFSHLTLAIAGDGPLKSGLRELARNLGLDVGQIIFLGIRDDVAALMSSADVFVLSSAWEGFGLVVAEAMACERVVVATDCGGVREVLGDCGFLVQPRDPVRLAQSLAAAFELDSRERSRLGMAARRRVEERYSIEAAAQVWLQIYERYQHEAATAGSHVV